MTSTRKWKIQILPKKIGGKREISTLYAVNDHLHSIEKKYKGLLIVKCIHYKKPKSCTCCLQQRKDFRLQIHLMSNLEWRTLHSNAVQRKHILGYTKCSFSMWWDMAMLYRSCMCQWHKNLRLYITRSWNGSKISAHSWTHCGLWNRRDECSGGLRDYFKDKPTEV